MKMPTRANPSPRAAVRTKRAFRAPLTSEPPYASSDARDSNALRRNALVSDGYGVPIARTPYYDRTVRLGRNAKIDLLKGVPLFAGCSKAELRELAATADEVDLREGHVLTREGRPGREFFVLIDGSVRVTTNGRKLAELSGGDWFGEIALLTKVPRTATVTATSPVRALVVTDRAFRRLVETMPSIALKVLASVGERLGHDAEARPGERSRQP
jgi:CRP/FNR family transcriptional regulator, cyclic AMP receptor protein